MTPRQIQVSLRDAGHTQKRIAEAMGVSNTTISQVIMKKTVSRRIMDHISSLLGKPPRDVFPEYFGLPDPAPEVDQPENTSA